MSSTLGGLLGRRRAARLSIARPWRIRVENAAWTRQLAIKASAVDSTTNSTPKRFPHSKLLRVCSDRNTNAHFAAIEAEMLRLDWQKSMSDLVKDWTEKNRSFVELERNVRSYVEKNLTDLRIINRERVEEWERDDRLRGALGLQGYLLVKHFPYEKVVTSAIQHAISGDVRRHDGSAAAARDDGDGGMSTEDELRRRMELLATSGGLLDSMIGLGSSRDGEGGDDNASETGPRRPKDVWSSHHESCSRCLRLMVSGWLLICRRRQAAAGEAARDNVAGRVEPEVSPDETSPLVPEDEMLAWTERWVDFCTVDVYGGERASILGGITLDDPLLMGVPRLLAMGGDPRRVLQSKTIEDRLSGVFQDDSK